jgi:hypothetical protein
MSGIEQPKKKTKRPRPGETYRQNGAQKIAPSGRWRAGPDVLKNRSFTRGHIGLNRSQNWPRAESYAHAREISPSREPVR